MTDQLIPITATDDGQQAVLGRDLHAFLGVQTRYNDWAARMLNYGFAEGTDYTVIKQEVPGQLGYSNLSNRRHDHILTLDMAKEIAMLQNTERGRAARRYFIECEKAFRSRPALTDDEIVRQALVITTDRVQELEAVLAVVGPKANTWDKLVADNGTDFGVADAAKMLSRDTGVTIGRNRLFQIMADKKWIYRRAGKRAGWCAYQSQVDLGRLHERMGTPFLNRTTGEFEITAPTIRLTAKGVEALHAHLVGNSAEIMSTPEQLELQEGA